MARTMMVRVVSRFIVLLVLRSETGAPTRRMRQKTPALYRLDEESVALSNRLVFAVHDAVDREL